MVQIGWSRAPKSFSITRAATCAGPTRAPRPTAAARSSPRACRIVSRWTPIIDWITVPRVRPVARRRNRIDLSRDTGAG